MIWKATFNYLYAFYPWIKCQIITNLDWNVKLGLASLHFEKNIILLPTHIFCGYRVIAMRNSSTSVCLWFNLEIIIERNFIDARTCANVPCNCFLYQTQWKLIFIFSDVPKNLLLLMVTRYDFLFKLYYGPYKT